MSREHPRTPKAIKAVFFDVDGTLLSFKTHKIPASAKRAIGLAKDRGILSFIATGRHPKSLVQDEWMLGDAFTGMVAVNGQFCILGDQVVYRNPLNPADVAKIVGQVERGGFSCLFMEDEGVYTNKIDDSTRRSAELTNTPLPPVKHPSRALSRGVYQICTFGKDPRTLGNLEHCAFTRWGGGWDIIPAGGNKWAGIVRLLERLSISPEETAAVGDSDNDLEMFGGAGYAIAMGGAPERIKAQADYITGEVDEDGIWEAIHHLFSFGEKR
ncbi:MAG: Cof-type HAD-IIB family hydrolase [Oscillospiraceae bacterium]|nr:Cof-type HAD-IIB family hydrolase [Oscillospiraceae bacterium]